MCPPDQPQHQDVLLIDDREDRVVVTLNRPSARNAINLEMIDSLHQVCAELERSPRFLVLRGSGGVFAAGADIRELRERGRLDALRGINSSLFERVARLPMPTVAVVDGAAIGGGGELAYACDFRIGTALTRFGNPEPGLGILAAAGACWRLTALIGEARAKEVLLTGRILKPDEALSWGLLTRLVDEGDDLDDVVDTFVGRMSAMDELALRLTKLVLHTPRDAHPVMDNVAQAVLFETQEKRDRMDAFLGKTGEQR
jgi:enoyl-CoA hydratase